MSAPTVPPTGTVTFLFTDIQGSTTLWEQHPDAMRLALARHDALLRGCIEDYGGFVFKTIGDAFCAAFAAAGQALEAALGAQITLGGEPWSTPTPVRVRMALHTGTAEERDGDYFGPTLNRVARLMATGHGGQVLLSGATQEIVQSALPPGADLLNLGRHRLKDLGRPEQVFQLQHPALPSGFEPLRSLDNIRLPNNLPQQPSSFIGRETQLAEIKLFLGKSRLLTLTGHGGTGKTRLSLQVAADLLDGEGDGVWFVELAALTDPALVPQAVADVLDIAEQAGQTAQRTLVDSLKSKRLLLVLDNCEHLVGACAALAADLLKHCPGVHILASSREALNVPGEQTYRVPTLSLPDPKQTQTVESMTRFESVRLFTERALAVQPSFAMTSSNAPAVAQVCSCLDGIPLAIELAAARVRSLSVEQISTRLDDRFRLLTGGSRAALPRQQTLRALVDWSYDLLTDSEKTLLRRLSVFAGGWTLAAAEAVCAGGEIEEYEVLDLLTSLLDKSLVIYDSERDGDRYRFLETVRQYASDRLRESREAETVQERAASWFLSFAEEAEPQLTGPNQAMWLSRLAAENDNLRASLTWHERTNEGSATGTEAGPGLENGLGVENGIRLAGALWRFWEADGHCSEGRLWLGRALERRRGAEYIAGFEGLAVHSKALNGAGNLAADQGDYAEARALHGESLALRRQLGDQQGIATSINNLGAVAYGQSDYAEARALFEESLAIMRQLGNQQGIANALGNVGTVAHRQGDHTAARVLQVESLAIFRQLGNQQGVANTLNNLGNVAYDQGDYPEARARHEESLTLRRQLGDQQGIAYGLEGMALAAYGLNQIARAAQLWGAASSLRDMIGCPVVPAEQEEVDKQIVSGRTALGEDVFAAAWDAGRAMTPDQAVEYALTEP